MSCLLKLSGLNAWYGESHILRDVNLTVHEGETVTLIGRNGSGRTTTLKSILGLEVARKGSVVIDGVECVAGRTYRIARRGIGYCPEERGMFASLSAEENLLLPPVISDRQAMTVEEIYELFPNLYERRASPASRLSGGEQQMLAIARILRTGAKLLLLDEISEGLAPVIVKRLGDIVQILQKKGYSFVLVEQNFRFVAPLTDRFYLMEYGQVVDVFDSADLPAKMDDLSLRLGV
ncbi:ABC transporter ATP-binding protein [Tardiphaga sp.]|jgi:branched-chain amino acid transport system ATP-binding protein|uniref:ABC transporter ATP-binding protein n=1 Tax=Tardiphaga sp. TaxID=1926292 RepID=UPI0037DA6961